MRLEEFWNYVDKTPTCWLWTRGTSKYGQFTISKVGEDGYVWKRNEFAHRTSFILANGDIPKHLTVDHICRVTRCVRPDHLRLLTRAENTAARYPTDTCERGHPRNKENTRFSKKGNGNGLFRQCRACERVRYHLNKSR